jgi:hypothetical protein
MNSISQIIDNMLEFYGARTSGTEERKLQRLARFVNFKDWHFEGVEEQPQQAEVPTTPQKKTKATRQEEPIAHRTRSRQAIAYRTRSRAH